MLKKLQLIVLFIFIATIGNAQLSQFTAPISKEYKEYIANQKAKVQASSSERSLGYVPPVVNLLDSYTNLPDEVADSLSGGSNNGVHLMAAAKALPSVFDLRKYKAVSSVKDQGTGNSGGNCWAFACMSSIESGWMVKGLGEYDLSEQNLSSCHGYAWKYGEGGNEFLAMGYLSRLNGPLNETDDRYNTNFTTCVVGKTPVAFVPETRWVAYNRVLIKQILMDYGAVSADIHWGEELFDTKTNSFCYLGNSSPNHAIALVGWDDTKVTSAGKGAWIAKNQWTTTWGNDGGFFYISYSDKTVANRIAYYPTLWNTNYINNCYRYDKAGVVTFLGSGNVAIGLVKYTAPQKQSIRKIGTFLARTGSSVGIEIFKSKNGDILKDTLSKYNSKPVRSPGFYVFDIPAVEVLDSFYIKVTYSTPGWFYPIPIEAKVDSTYANPTIEKSGEQWVMLDGKKWQPIGSDIKGLEADLVIHAYSDKNLGPKANFEISKNEVCLGTSVLFTDTSSKNIDTYTWNFGVGANPAKATGKGPHLVSFLSSAATGLRTATLKITGSDGSDSISKDYRVVDKLLPVFGAPNYIVAGDTARLTAITDGDTYSWHANVDLINANTNEVLFTNKTPGRYKFTITANQGACTGTSTLDLFVKQPPPNDDMCNAIELNVGDNGPFTNRDATVQLNEPAPTDTSCTALLTWCDEQGLQNSVWFKFIGPSSGVASFDTRGMDTQIAIYSSPSCDNIKKADLIAANDDYYGVEKLYAAAIESVTVTPGKTYWLQMDGSHGGDTGIFYIKFNDTKLGIIQNKINQVNLDVYPNPNNGLMDVKFSSPYAESFNIEIFDLTGKMILTKNVRKGNGDFILPIDLQGSPKGIYFVNLRGERSFIETKFVLQ